MLHRALLELQEQTLLCIQRPNTLVDILTIVAGVLVVRDAELANQIKFVQNAAGAICGPVDSFLALGE